MSSTIKLESAAPQIRFREPQIEMAHGAGGKASRRLVEGLSALIFFGASYGPLGDAAHLQINGARVAVTTDAFVVKTSRISRRLHWRTCGQRHSK